jgi:hypothetical protein
MFVCLKALCCCSRQPATLPYLTNIWNKVGFEVLTAVSMKIAVFIWNKLWPTFHISYGNMDTCSGFMKPCANIMPLEVTSEFSKMNNTNVAGR